MIFSTFLLTCIFSNVPFNVKASTSYCDNEFCAKPDKYCCGANECCSYVWSLWYLWFSFGAGIFISLFLLWKYYFKIRNNKNLNLNIKSSRFFSIIGNNNEIKNNERFSNINDSKFAYKLLNDDTFIENQIDEQVIQVNYSSQNKQKFVEILKNSNHLVILTGAGISAESGIPTFRSKDGGFWRDYSAQELATPSAFIKDPSLVWKFYQYRREVVLKKLPNKGHISLVSCEEFFLKRNKKFKIITQNVDALHLKAGSKNVLQMHGNILETKCTKCKNIQYNTEKLVDCSSNQKISFELLPKCKLCSGLLRPNVVWFNERLDTQIMKNIDIELNSCDLFLIIGTSGQVYPAAGFGCRVKERNVPIAEINTDEEANFSESMFYFKGKAGDVLSEIMNFD